MAKKNVASGSNLPSGFKKEAESDGYVFKDRNVELSKWKLGETVRGAFIGFKDGKKFNNNSEPSQLVKFRVEGKTVVYACPRVLYNLLEDVEPGKDVIVVCLGQVLKIKDRKEPAWDFEVAIKS